MKIKATVVHMILKFELIMNVLYRTLYKGMVEYILCYAFCHMIFLRIIFVLKL